MDPEASSTIEDSKSVAKRKRSPGTSSSSSQDLDFQRPGTITQEAPTRHGTKDLSKRPRVRNSTPGVALDIEDQLLTNIGQCFPLPPFPQDVLSHIMSFLDPPSLGRVMCVNKHMHRLLDPYYGKVAEAGPGTSLTQMSVETLWKCSRRAYFPGMPHPLKSLSELEMFRLIYSKRCQHCGLLPRMSSTKQSTRPWNLGPGPSGVRTIWPFKVKLCANCLKPLLVKETDLVHLGVSHLASGLQSASFTPSLHYVPATLSRLLLPPGLNITNFYFKPHIEQLSQESSGAQSQGSVPFGVWLRELDALRQEADTDTLRVEAWDMSEMTRTDALAGSSSNMNSRSSASGSSIYSDNLTRSHFTSSSGAYLPQLSNQSGKDFSTTSGAIQTPSTSLQVPQTDWDSTARNIAPRTTVRTTPHGSGTSHTGHFFVSVTGSGSVDVVQLRNDKRIDIQQRCRNLNPPIEPAVLERLSAFYTALHVLMPLDDISWGKLRAELLGQRYTLELLEQSEHMSGVQSDPLDSATTWRAVTPIMEPLEEDPRQQAAQPVREKLSRFASEYVHRRYRDGHDVTHSTAPQFAADVLVHTFDKFYRNQAQEDAAFAAHGEQPPDEGPSGIRTRTLKLEHMRHVFETTIKPYTEFIRKELFLCPDCDAPDRFFAFEGMIQHFASKHTDKFSRGDAIVYWKSEWPINPPFKSLIGSDPVAAQNHSHAAYAPHVTVSTDPLRPYSTMLEPPLTRLSGQSERPSNTQIPSHRLDEMYRDSSVRHDSFQSTEASIDLPAQLSRQQLAASTSYRYKERDVSQPRSLDPHGGTSIRSQPFGTQYDSHPSPLEPERPSRQSPFTAEGVSSAPYAPGMIPEREIYRHDESRTFSTAERFLESFDVVQELDPQTKTSARSITPERPYRRPTSQDVDREIDYQQRRPNMSQPRRGGSTRLYVPHDQPSSFQGHTPSEPQVPTYRPDIWMKSPEREVNDQRHASAPINRQFRHTAYTHINPLSEELPRYQELSAPRYEREPYVREYDQYQRPQVRYVNYQGRLVDARDVDPRQSETHRLQPIIYERHREEARPSHVREYIPSEREVVFWDPELGRYVVKRPVQEYDPEAQQMEHGRGSDRPGGIVYEGDHRLSRSNTHQLQPQQEPTRRDRYD